MKNIYYLCFQKLIFESIYDRKKKKNFIIQPFLYLYIKYYYYYYIILKNKSIDIEKKKSNRRIQKESDRN